MCRVERGRQLVGCAAAAAFAGIAWTVERRGACPGDGPFLRALLDVTGSRIDTPAKAVARATDSKVVAIGAALVALALVVRRRFVDAAVVGGAVGVVLAVNPRLKEAFERPRPDARVIPIDVSQWSFPSGHASASAAALGAAVLVARSLQARRAAWIAGSFAVVLVAVTQLALGAHHPSDIAAGWLWAVAWISLLGGLRPEDRSPGSHGPAPASGGEPAAASRQSPLPDPADAAASVRPSCDSRTPPERSVKRSSAVGAETSSGKTDDMAQFDAMPDDWNRALAIVAHPDDLEYGASAAVAVWTDAGKSVRYVLASRGEAGIDGIEPELCGPLREREQIEAARRVGVDSVEFLDHRDGVIEHSLALRRDLAAMIRRHRPELVITLNHHDTWGNGWWNSADHRNLGRAVLDAVADAGNRWVFADLHQQQLEPWNGVRWVAISGSPLAGHAVDVTTGLDRAVASLEAHREYLRGLGDGAMSDPRSFLTAAAQQTARGFGGRLSTSFELLSR